MVDEYILRLYVTGHTPNSERALANLNALIKENIAGVKYKLTVIDVLEHPQLAEDEKILATPVLQKKLPPPVREIIGDLSNKEKVLMGLDLVPVKKKAKKGGKK